MRTRSERIRVKLRKFFPDQSDDYIAGQFVQLRRRAKTIAILELAVDTQLDRKIHDFPALKDMVSSVSRRYSKPTLPPKEKPGSAYHNLWAVVDGAVRDAFHNHPEYLTDKGRQSARMSVVKRVTGSVISFAKAKGRRKAVDRDRGSGVSLPPSLNVEGEAPL